MIKLVKKLNNQGSTLITVIICMALFGILGSLMLSVTMTNLQMKMVESKAKKNFYSCEETMEEIRTGIQEITAAKIQEVYETKILTDFSSFLSHPDDDSVADNRNEYIRKQVAVAIMTELGNIGSFSPEQLTSGTEIPEKGDDIFNTYLSVISNPDIVRTVTIGDSITNPDTIHSNGDTVVIEDIKVEMEIDDYKTSITSDIVITLPTFTFEEGSEITVFRMEPPLKNYVLITDGTIKSEQNLIGVNSINGNVYAGDGIYVSSPFTQQNEMIIIGDNIITRGNINVADTGKLTINGRMVWADNLVTNTTDLPGFTLLPTTLNINGICFVKDDLNLEGLNSEVTLTGAYVGFTGIQTEEGSAVILNGAGSSLNLSGLESLILAGRAHVSVDDTIIGSDTDIMTGESLAFKSNQRAYLISGDFIDVVGHNPVTKVEIDNLGFYPGVIFDAYDPLDPFDIYYESYVPALPSTLKPYKLAAKLTVGGNPSSALYYYYLNFASGWQADEFFNIYASKYLDVLNNMIPFTLGNVTLPIDTATEEVLSVGNLMSYNGTEVQIEAGRSSELLPRDGSVDLDDLLDQEISGKALNHLIYQPAQTAGGLQSTTTVGNLEGLYSKITHLLSLESTKAYVEEDEVVKSAVYSTGIDYIDSNFNDITGEFMCYTGDLTFGSTPGESIILVRGNVNINCNFSGLLAATGNITIGDGVTITGMVTTIGVRDPLDPEIISGGGNITLGNNVSVNGRLVAVGDISLGVNDTLTAMDDTSLTDAFDNYADILKNLYTNAELTKYYTIAEPASNTVTLAGMISYDNWRKN